MKPILLLSLVLGCALPLTVNGTSLRALPADTVPGHTHLVRRLVQTMCAQLADPKSGPARNMTPAEATQYAQQLYARAVSSHSTAYQQQLNAADKAGISPDAAVQRVAKDAQAALWRNCAASVGLFSQLAQTQQIKQVLAGRLLDIGAAERRVLQPVARAVCQQLAAADKQLAISQRPLREQDVLVEGSIRKSLAAQRPQLETFYSTAQLSNQDYIREIIVKVMLLVVGPEGCGQYVVPPAADE
ncbi:hypothetical protein EJV47_19925 [Hymenobacter gummosus]|uniref:Secreted protein n=1 Tax=Hymenobacter gummosus TaxID=1776032 RepID=A0A3S0K303_9BACT|nr:hypothetical protein [Hymenobacter gummosus]RTQ47166.1 hypothetical protein EJV47_19925 [Hymenobacter gummosus]